MGSEDDSAADRPTPTVGECAPADQVRLGRADGRWVLAATVVGSAIAMVTATVVNVALPALAEDLGADVAGRQWVITSYLLSLSSLLLLGGSLGDRFGRRRVFGIGVAWFAVASLLCAVAPTLELLIAARVLQGVGGALLTPGSLAIIQASFVPGDRPAAIGAWSALGAIGAAAGPLLGGILIDVLSWRWVFVINVPLAVAVIAVTATRVPESRDPAAAGRLDVGGALLSMAALGGITFATIQAPVSGVGSPTVVVAAAAGLAAAVAFVAVERRHPTPMLPLEVFASRQFSAANLLCFVVYAALGGTFFLLVQQLQISLGWSATAAGAASLPITGLMLVLSTRAGAFAQRHGPRLPLTVGPALIAVGMVGLSGIGPGDAYLTTVLPPLVVFGLGLAATVAPVTATVLAAADEGHSGIASGVNNTVSRVAQLLAVAALPALAGLSGLEDGDVAAFTDGYRTAMRITAGLAAAGAVLAWTTIRDDVLAGDREEGAPASEPHQDWVCGADSAPLRPALERTDG